MSTNTLTAADFSEWTQYVGLYLHNVSHTDRYRTFQAKISAAGLAVKIVFDFLQDNQGGINLQTWRNSYVYEMPADAKWRVEQTSKSLDAVGATRIAARMPTLKNTSLGGMLMDSDNPMSLLGQMQDIDPVKLMEELRGNVARAMPDMAAAAGIPKPPQPPADTDIESWEQIEHLLGQFVKSHESELRADMAKHGDPRIAPSFNPEARMAELDRLRRAEYDKEAQREDVPKMTHLIEQIAHQIAENSKIKPGDIARPRRELLELYRKYAQRSANELLPEMQQCVDQVAQFQEQHRDLFQPKPIDDEKLLKRLANLGDYDVDMGNKNVRVTYETPAGLTCDWTTFRLSLQYSLRDKKQLKAMLDTCDRVRKNFTNHAAELRLQVLESFEMSREHLENIGLLDQYERDDEGEVTAESILANAGVGNIHLNSTVEFEDGDAIQVYFAIEWDEEHGLQLFIDDAPDTAPEEKDATHANVGMRDSGPPIDAEQISAFENEHDVKLPADYRTFLMHHNGGRPEPNHLKLKFDGSPVPVFVDRLFSIGGTNDNDLGAAIEMHRAKNRPAHLLPIGVVHMPGPMGESVKCQLLMGVGGKQQGKILAAYDMSAMMMPGQLADNAQAAAMMAAMFESFCQVVAPNVRTFLSKLTPAPQEKMPAWLQAIRNNEVEAFVAARPKLDAQFTPYGESRLLTVLDYVTLEAAPAFVEELARRGLVKAKQLRESWQRVSLSTARFRQLMTVLGQDNLRYAFAARDIWDDLDLLNGLIAAKVDLEANIGPEGETPLHLAILSHRPDGVRWLLEHGASTKTRDTYGRSALEWAESERQLECMKQLILAGESIESLFRHMPTLPDKLRLLKSRWMVQFADLADFLRSQGMNVNV